MLKNKIPETVRALNENRMAVVHRTDTVEIGKDREPYAWHDEYYKDSRGKIHKRKIWYMMEGKCVTAPWAMILCDEATVMRRLGIREW